MHLNCFVKKTSLFQKTRSACYIPINSDQREKLGIHTNRCLTKIMCTPVKSRHTYELNKWHSLILLLYSQDSVYLFKLTHLSLQLYFLLYMAGYFSFVCRLTSASCESWCCVLKALFRLIVRSWKHLVNHHQFVNWPKIGVFPFGFLPRTSTGSSEYTGPLLAWHMAS